MKLFYTQEALADLQRLKEFLEEKSPKAAMVAAAEIITGICRLKDFPLIGTPVNRAPNPEMIRDLILGDYLARYVVLSDSIHILRIWHHKENLRYS